MSNATTSARRRWSIIVAALLVVAAFFLVRWIVMTQRPPGAMTVIEAQAMDMTTMRAPEGVQPVAAEPAEERSLAGEEQFPGTIVAWSDEEVVARIPGRVVKMPVYPGDTVRPGQLLAQLEADEFAAQAAEASARARAAGLSVTVAEAEVQRLMAARARAAADAEAADLAVQRSAEELAESSAEIARARAEVEATEARLKEADAERAYLVAAAERERELYKRGAASLDEVQLAESKANQARERVAMLQSEVAAKRQGVAQAEAKRNAAATAVNEAKRRAQAAQESVREADRAVAKARAEVSATRAQRQAEEGGAATTRVISGYRELRALDEAVVTERLVSPGTLVQPGQTLMRLKVVKRVRVQFDLPERLVGVVREGTRVHVGDREARITAVFGAVDPSTRTFRAEAAIDNPDRSLIPGQFVSVSVQTAPAGKRLAVRQEAIREAPDGSHFVWVMVPIEATGEPHWTCPMHPEVHESEPGDCPICKMPLVRSALTEGFRAEPRKVTPGPTDGRYTAVQGIEPGDMVIYRGHEQLRPGLPVANVKWGDTGPLELPKGSGSSGHEHGGAEQQEQPRPGDEHAGH
jgi:multidrug efflux pump subunit AcrA (membrane-fusion protein)